MKINDIQLLFHLTISKISNRPKIIRTNIYPTAGTRQCARHIKFFNWANYAFI